MPITFEYRHGPGSYLTVTFSGNISSQELIAAWKNFLESDQWIPGSSVLDDLSNADMSTFKYDDITDYVDFVESFLKAKGRSGIAPKIALYAPVTLNFGLARTFDGIGVDIAGAIKVFKDRQKAIDWLTE